MDFESILFDTGNLKTKLSDKLYDTAETVQIAPIALLKMLRHGRAGVPLEVMGLMLGEFVDDFTITIVDVFAMPQTGTGVSVEAVDPVFQATMLEMLAQVGRTEKVVGWYHSHPGFGCWLSNVDIQTQRSFETLDKRAVAVVVDPIQSVRGSVVIDAFRLIEKSIYGSTEPRQCTSNIGMLKKPTGIALSHGLNKHYYSLNIKCTMSDLEKKVLLNLQQQPWIDLLTNPSLKTIDHLNNSLMKHIDYVLSDYIETLDEETCDPSISFKESRKTRFIGRKDPRNQLIDLVTKLRNNSLYNYINIKLDAHKLLSKD